MTASPFSSRDGASLVRAALSGILLLPVFTAPCSGNDQARLVITPDEPFVASGDALGVVSPLSKQYTLTNSGTAAATVGVEFAFPVHAVDTPFNNTLGPGESFTVRNLVVAGRSMARRRVRVRRAVHGS